MLKRGIIPLRIDLTEVAQSKLNFFDYIRSIEDRERKVGYTIEAIILPLGGATMFGFPVFSSDFEYQKWKEKQRKEEENRNRPLPYN